MLSGEVGVGVVHRSDESSGWGKPFIILWKSYFVAAKPKGLVSVAIREFLLY